MKVTTRMLSKWVKAFFLVLLGVVLALYVDKFVTDLEDALVNDLRVEFQWTWGLLTILLWILVAWLFVLAALTVAQSLKEDMYTLWDVMSRLRAIEKRLGVRPAKARLETHEEAHEVSAAPEVQAAPEEEVPPPPAE